MPNSKCRMKMRDRARRFLCRLFIDEFGIWHLAFPSIGNRKLEIGNRKPLYLRGIRHILSAVDSQLSLIWRLSWQRVWV
jgi:hypothetical protein